MECGATERMREEGATERPGEAARAKKSAGKQCMRAREPRAPMRASPGSGGVCATERGGEQQGCKENRPCSRLN